MNKQSAALLSVISNSTLVIFKIIAGIAMGSVSVLSEAIHSGIDLIASCVAWISIKLGSAPADNDHPFGHGKFENVSGFFEAILIFVAAALIISEAIKKLMHPGEIEQVSWGIAVMGFSALVNTIVSINLFRIAKKTDSIALEADAMHLSVDVFTSIGVMIGLIAIHVTGLAILDPIIAIVVAGMIIHAAWDLTRRSLDDLLDKALPDTELATINDILQKTPGITSFHKLRTRRTGEVREIDCHIRVAAATEIVTAHSLCHSIEDEIKGIFPKSHVTIHVEPEHRL